MTVANLFFMNGMQEIEFLFLTCYNHLDVEQIPDSPLEGDIRIESVESARHFRVKATVELPPGADVQLTIQYRPDEKTPYQSKVVNITGSIKRSRRHLSFDLKKLFVSFNGLKWMRTWRQKVFTPHGPPFYFLLGALLVYYLLRLIRLSDFPIFFFTDEAIHTLLAADLVKNGFMGTDGEFLPTFFKSAETFNAGFPVYLQVLHAWLGIRSVFMTRFISTTTTLLAAASLGLIFARVHNERRGWLPVLILSIIPAWFYHSRTAFETVEAVSFYAVFLLGYLKYRNGDFRCLYVSVGAAALSFYSYSPARVVTAVMAVLLLISDARFHWENRKKLWKPLLVGIALCIPYLRFLYLHPDANQHHLELLDSFWISPQPFSWKMLQFFTIYLQGLNPFYWFYPNEMDLPRHIMKGMGHLGWFFFPFFIGGLLISLSRWKNPGYRLMLLSLLSAPAGAAMVGIGITRAMFMVIPAAFLTAVGADYVIDWVSRRSHQQKSIDIYIFLLLIASNFLFLDKVLTDGPLWFNDYGMNGMQYGGEQVFGRIKEIRKKDPKVPIVLSPDWANGTDVLARYHLGDPVPVQLSSLNAYIQEQLVFSDATIFIMPPNDFINVISSRKFEPMQVLDTLFYPDGKPGFIFAHLKYNKTAFYEFEKEKALRYSLEGTQVTIADEEEDAISSRLDMGGLQHLFDDNPITLIRSKESNPLVVEFSFAQPRIYHSIWLRIGGEATQLSIYVIPEGSDTPLVNSISVGNDSQLRKVSVPLATGKPINRMRIEILSINDMEPSHVHLWDMGLE